LTSSLLTIQKAWPRIKRKPVAGGPAPRAAGRQPEHGQDQQDQGWVYLLISREGREYPVSPVARMGWPQGCDQCHQVIQPGACDGAHSFSVVRGRTPTALYVCGTCVGALCTAGGIPLPGDVPIPGEESAGATGGMESAHV
jgi:hypothetical protein